MPMRWNAVSDRSQFVSQRGNEFAREQEVMAIYGITMQQLQKIVAAPGATVRALPPMAYTADGARHGFANVPL